MNQEIPNEPIYDRKVLEVLTVANDFCLFIEKAENHTRENILLYLQKVIPLLYIKGSVLPTVELSNPAANEKFVTEEHWENVFNVLRAKFNPADEFWTIESHEPGENEPVKCSLADKISDVYQDMKDFIILYQKNTRAAKECAVADCKKFFETHWGYRAVDALQYIHYLLNREKSNTPISNLDL